MNLFVPPCGHILHHECVKLLTKTSYTCPTCNKSLQEMSHVFQMVSDEIAHTPMPHEMYVSQIKVWYLFYKEQRICLELYTVNSTSTVAHTKHHFDSVQCLVRFLYCLASCSAVYSLANRLAPAPAHQQLMRLPLLTKQLLFWGSPSYGCTVVWACGWLRGTHIRVCVGQTGWWESSATTAT
jgi:hypothetical protein